MSKRETLTAYKCTFSYLKRNNPLKEEVQEKIKKGIPPQYSFHDFIKDFSKFTSSLAVGKNTERAILLSEENIYPREEKNGVFRWRIVPNAGKQGKPFRIIKKSTGKRYDFNLDSAALYEHNIFIYQSNKSAIIIFHRQNGSGCKSVFLETSNCMLKEKGIKLDMELYIPLLSPDINITPTKITLQYYRNNLSSDIAENIQKKKRSEVIRDLGLNLQSYENKAILDIFRNMQMGRISPEEAFAKIKLECSDSEDYNDAEIMLRIGNRKQTVRWNEFDAILGNYDITEQLKGKYINGEGYISGLTELADKYYSRIITEENEDAE